MEDIKAYKRTIKTTLKNLKDNVEILKNTGCSFWACEGYETNQIKAMITCSVCRSVITTQREIKRLQHLIDGTAITFKPTN